MGFSKTQINPVFGLSKIENIISLFDLQDVFAQKTNLNAKEGGERFREREDIEKLERGVTKRGDLRGLCGSWGWVWVEEWRGGIKGVELGCAGRGVGGGI